jgi:hypothetical protein
VITPAPVTFEDIADLSRWEMAILPGVTFTFAGNRTPIVLNREARRVIDPQSLRTIQRHNTWLYLHPVPG